MVGTSQNNTVTFGALWTSTHLYVGIKVLEPTTPINDTANSGTPPTNVWQDDSVEVYIDGNHNHATSYELTGGANGLGNDRQFLKGYNDSALFNKGSATGVTHAWAAITGGYTVEIAIPWSNINVTGAAGLTIGFDVGNNDDDNGGTTRETQVVWNGTATNYNNTAAFGHLTLSATTVGGGAPEVNVQGAGLNILDGDTTPQTADGTDFGSADITSGTVQKVFNIQNTGSATLTLANVTTTNSEFGVLAQPALSIAAGGNSNFTIAFNPTVVGTRTATLSFTNNDTATPSESPYTFAVTGTGTSAPVRGAVIPWTYYEAEGPGATTNGTIVSGTLWGQVAFEARGRKAVQLNAAGKYVQWTATAPADRAIVRYNVPAGTTSATLALKVNGNLRATLPLSDFRLYELRQGAADAGVPAQFYFDDVLAAITPAIAVGDVVRLEKTSGTTVFTIDFLELELAPAPIAKPTPTAVWEDIVTEHGAVSGSGNDRQAFINAINAAVASGKNKV